MQRQEVGESSEESMQTWYHIPVVAETPQCHPCSDAPRDKPNLPAGYHFYFSPWNKHHPGTSLVVQWLRLHAFNARAMGSIPG